MKRESIVFAGLGCSVSDVRTADVVVLPQFPPPAPPEAPWSPMGGSDRHRLEGPPSRITLPTGQQAWVFTRHEDVRQILRSPAFSADIERPGFPLLRELPPAEDRDRRGAFIRMDGAEHARLRRMLTGEFMIKNVRRIEPLILETVTRFLDEMAAAGPPADLVASFALPVPSLVVCHLLGVPYADHDFFQRRSRILLDLTTGLDEVRAAVDELRGYLRDLVVAKRSATDPDDDLLGRLAARVEAGELDPEEVTGVALLLLIAGHETTANMIGLSTLLLTRHPESLAGLREDPGRAPALVEELLRYLTIVRSGLPRLAVEDVEVGGFPVRAGEGVFAMLSLANRDGATFADAERFDPNREPNQHVAFGFGVHQCIGQPLARAE